MIELMPHSQGTIVPVHAQPGARRSAILGEHDGALRVAVTAPADKGKANAAIAALLVAAIGVKPSQVALLSGPTSRRKRFLIQQITPQELARRLAGLLPGEPPAIA